MEASRLVLPRRSFLAAMLGGAASTLGCSIGRAEPARLAAAQAGSGSVQVSPGVAGEDLFSYIARRRGGFAPSLYRQILGAANAFKEGDALIGVAAADAVARRNARLLLGNTCIGDLFRHPALNDRLTALLNQSVDANVAARIAGWRLSELRRFLLLSDAAAIQKVLPGLPSEVIGCVVKLLQDEELIAVSAKLFHPLPGSQLGAPGYLGARLQPTSPTDHVDDVLWQVLNGFSYAVGDVVIGANPASGDAAVVAGLSGALTDLLLTFEIADTLPHAVLAPVDIQAAVEEQQPGTTGIWFQSLAGSDRANGPLGVSVEKMLRHAARRRQKWGFYFETGQGGELESGSSDGCDLVLHEARRYGFARALKQAVAAARGCAVSDVWLHVNDVAGFYGPRVFRNREQLVRCCLEDLVMGKLHGLMMGLDVCAAKKSGLSHQDLDWVLEQVVPAGPGYLVGLPTKHDPLLGHESTAFVDHVRLRQKFGLKVNDGMRRFFEQLGVLDEQGLPTDKFGDPTWVYLQYRRRKGDLRSDGSILAEGHRKVAEVESRGVPLSIAAGSRYKGGRAVA
jgi:ethanolamine ammonia-lyase large subunit